MVAGIRFGLASVAPSGFRREFYARYAGFADWTRDPVKLSIEASGAGFFRGPADGLGERTVNHVTVAGRLTNVVGEPALFLRIPLDAGARGAVDFVTGLRLRF